MRKRNYQELNSDSGSGWAIEVSDGYCIYRYEFPDGRDDCSIHDVAMAVKRELKSKQELKEKFIRNERRS